MTSSPPRCPPRRELPYAAWMTIQIGCDNSCAFCIVPAVRGPEISRPFGEIGRRGRAAGRRRRHRGHPAGTERELLRSRPDLRLHGERPRREAAAVAPQPAVALPVGDRSIGIRRRPRYTSPHPKDLRPETIAAMAGHAVGVRAPPPPAAVGERPVLAAMHRGYTGQRYLERSPRPARGSTISPSPPTSSSGSPARPRTTSRRRWRRGRGGVRLPPSRSSTRPAPGRRRRRCPSDFVDHAVAVERMERLRIVVERTSRLGNEARIGRVEEVLVEGPSKTRPAILTGRTRQNKLVHFRPTEPSPRPGSYATSRSRGPACRA